MGCCDVISSADWLIDLGPGAGHDGCEVAFQGPPADLITCARSLTARHLTDPA